MTDLQIAQLVVGLIAAITPWCVVRIAFGVAARHAQSVERPLTRPAAVRSLGRFTAGVVPAIALAAVLLPAPSLWMAAVDLIAFASCSVIGLRALGAISEAARPAWEAATAVRVASLQRRRLSDYVPRAWRLALFGPAAVGLALFIWRLLTPVPDRRLVIPIVFALAAVVFAWLYDVWMRQLALGGQTTDIANVDVSRRRTVRAVFVVEALLVSGCLLLAHALLNLNWVTHGPWGVAGALAGACLGVIGCALAISSELIQRRYRVV